MGRLHHLRRTLPENILHHQNVKGVEFVVLDYSSPDGLEGWIKEGFNREIETGTLVYAKVNGMQTFRRSHAKNLSHLIASGSIVCNLDADNFTGPEFGNYLTERFSEGSRFFYKTEKSLDAHGRIAFRKSDFCALGGYDEALDDAWGAEDDDLTARAVSGAMIPFSLRRPSQFLHTIMHDDEERVRYLATKNVREGHRRNMQISRKLRELHPIIANPDRTWGSATLIKNFSEAIQVGCNQGVPFEDKIEAFHGTAQKS